ncbi:hypothetical protein GO001_11330 [Streptomyces sp. NRRL B-1677]|uniref:Uncharacterized protein n=1 Tax=Streptomyces klenkii TaxID=1420899 RepID=A0A3B0BXB3_9ACTN|nr:MULTISPECIES: hypothetical protein [Streptomyces]MBF6045809.1 hypothetical protein [Streptomyces sp. NRRL B-1677]RKN76517.1 hypothetical protein D7231_05905 [Streptomyces klenkii]
MKLRHVRAAAVFGIAVVALTGARGHHGGGCSGGSSSHHSSSSTSGGTTTTGGTSGGSTSTDGGLTTGGTTTSGSTSGGTSTSGLTSGGTTTGGSSANASRDLKIVSCDYSDARGITAKISVTNPSLTDSNTYTFSVKFTDATGALIGTRNRTIPFVGPGKTDTQDVSQVYVPKAGASVSGKCEVNNVTRTKSN